MAQPWVGNHLPDGGSGAQANPPATSIPRAMSRPRAEPSDASSKTRPEPSAENQGLPGAGHRGLS
jgi:hypothetical protein